MGNIEQNDFVWKGTEFWRKEIEKAGVLDKLRFFNDVVGGNQPPHPEAGEPVLRDVLLDGRITDIYHSDRDDNDHFHRIYLHHKN